MTTDDARQRWPAQPNAESATILRGHLEVGVGQHDDRVLGAALALHALAVGRGAAVDVARDRCRADERDRAHRRVVEQGVHGVLAAVHQVQHAGGEAGLLGELEDLRHRHRGLLRRLQDQRVAAGDRVGQEPQRDHAGEVERRDDADDAHRLPDHHARRCPRRCLRGCCPSSSTGCRWPPRRSRCRAAARPRLPPSVLPHSCVMRRATSLNCASSSAFRRKSGWMRSPGGRAAPRGQRLLGRLDRACDRGGRRERGGGQHLAGRGVVHGNAGRRVCALPAATDEVEECSLFDHGAPRWP